MTNLQLELLKLFARQVPEEDLQALRRFLTQMFAEKAMDAADKVWEQEGWTEDYADQLSRKRMRTPYRKSEP